MDCMKIIVDVEWIWKNHEIVTMIGALKIDKNEDIIDTFRAVIEPDVNDTIKELKKLPISESDIQQRRPKEDAIRDFRRWSKDCEQFLLWGDSNCKVLEEFLGKPEGNTYVDVQSLFCKNNGVPLVGLNKVCKSYAVKVIYPMHDSLNDAYTLWEVTKKIIHSEKMSEAEVNKIKLIEIKTKQPFIAHNGILHKSTCSCLNNQDYRTLEGQSTISGIYDNLRFCSKCFTAIETTVEMSKERMRHLREEYDFVAKNKIIHQSTCRKIKHADDREAKGYRKIQQFLAEGCTPCPRCMKNIDEIKHNNIEALEKAKETYPYVLNGRYLHTSECSLLDELSTEKIRGFERIEDALELNVPLCSYCIGEYVVSKPASINRVDTVRINKLHEMCKMFGFRSDLHGELFFIKTDVATWYFDTEKCNTLYHNNHVFATRRKEGLLNFHKQPKKFVNPEEIVLYIEKHDKAVITGKSLRMVR